MRTPLQALLWELWRTSRFEILIRVGGQSAFIVLFCSLAPLGAQGSSEAHVHVVRGIALLILLTSSVFSATWLNGFDNRQAGFSFRLGFTRPISTTRLVVVPMIFSVLTAVACYLLPALLIILLLNLSMPLLGPGAIVACTVACLIAAAWFPATLLGRGLGVAATVLAIAVIALVFNSLRDDPDPILLAIGKPDYLDFGWRHYAMFLVLTVIAIVMTVVGVDRQRHGDGSPLEGFWVRLASSLKRLPGGPRGSYRDATGTVASRLEKPFANAMAAQFWYETRRFGQKLLLLGVLAPLLPLSFVCIVPWVDTGWDAAPVVWLAALAFCPFVYQLVGVDGAIGLRINQGAARYSSFDAARAMRSDQLVAIKLLVIAAYSLFGWLCMGLAAGLHTIAAGDWRAWSRVGAAVTIYTGEIPVHWWLVGLSDAVLFYVSSTSMFLAFGLWLPLHRVFFGCVAAVLYSHMILGAVDVASDLDLRYLWVTYGYLLSAAIVVGCFVALRKARSAGLLGRRLFAGAFCLWVIYVASTLAVYFKFASLISVPPVTLVLGASQLLVPLAATAFAPLALAAHRHA